MKLRMCGVLMHRGMESWQSQVGEMGQSNYGIWADTGLPHLFHSCLARVALELIHLLGKHWMEINNFKIHVKSPMDINDVSFIKSSSFHDSEDKSKTQFLILSKQGKKYICIIKLRARQPL